MPPKKTSSRTSRKSKALKPIDIQRQDPSRRFETPEGRVVYKPLPSDYPTNRAYAMAKVRFESAMSGKLKGVRLSQLPRKQVAKMKREFLSGDSIKEIAARHGIPAKKLTVLAKRKPTRNGRKLPSWYELRDSGDEVLQAEIQSGVAAENGKKLAEGYVKHLARNKTTAALVETMVQNKLLVMLDGAERVMLKSGREVAVPRASLSEIQKLMSIIKENHRHTRMLYDIDKEEKGNGGGNTFIQNNMILKAVQDMTPADLNRRLQIMHHVVMNDVIPGAGPVGDNRKMLDSHGASPKHLEALFPTQQLPDNSEELEEATTVPDDGSSE